MSKTVAYFSWQDPDDSKAWTEVELEASYIGDGASAAYMVTLLRYYREDGHKLSQDPVSTTILGQQEGWREYLIAVRKAVFGQLQFTE